ncbi:MAG: MFS transporter [Dehalococcoidia bacterium]
MRQRIAASRARTLLGPGATTILLLGVTSFLTDVSSEMTFTVLPIFLTGTLGVSVATVGIIEGVGESTAALSRLFAGRLSDRLPRRLPVVVAGYGLSALTKPLFALAGGAGLAGILRFADRVGKGVRTAPRDALIADAASHGQRGLAFGVHRAADTSGAVLGVSAAALLLGLLGADEGLTRGEFQRLVLLAGIPAILGVLLLTRISEQPHSVEATREEPRRLLALPESPAERRYLLVVLAFALGNSSDAFLVLRMVDAGLGVVAVLIVLAGRNLVEAFLSIPAGVLSDRLGRRRLLLAGYFVYALMYSGLAFAESEPAVVLLILGYGAYYGATEGMSRAFVADLSPAGGRGASFGWFHLATAVTALPASVVAGVLWTTVGPEAAFMFGSACALVAFALLTTVRPPRTAAS